MGKKVLIVIATMFASAGLLAQNVGIGTSAPAAGRGNTWETGERTQ
jgi:hypothetical protein